MQKKSIFFIIIVIIAVTGFIIISGNLSSKSGRSPQIIISEEEWDFSMVKPEEKPIHIFTIKNEEDADLIINKVETYEHIKHNINVPLNIIPGEDYEQYKDCFHKELCKLSNTFTITTYS